MVPVSILRVVGWPESIVLISFDLAGQSCEPTPHPLSFIHTFSFYGSTRHQHIVKHRSFGHRHFDVENADLIVAALAQ